MRGEGALIGDGKGALLVPEKGHLRERKWAPITKEKGHLSDFIRGIYLGCEIQETFMSEKSYP